MRFFFFFASNQLRRKSWVDARAPHGIGRWTLIFRKNVRWCDMFCVFWIQIWNINIWMKMDGRRWMDEYGKFRWFLLCAGFDNLLSRMPASGLCLRRVQAQGYELFGMRIAHRFACMMYDGYANPRTCIQVPCILHRIFIVAAAHARKLLFSLFLLREWKMEKNAGRRRKTHNRILNMRNLFQ